MSCDAYTRYQKGRYTEVERDEDATEEVEVERLFLTAFEHKDGPIESAATLPTCPKTCKSCLEHYRPLQWQETWAWLEYNFTYEDEKTEEIVREHVDKARASLANVRDKLERFGNAIAKRWMKKNMSKRASLLRTASPSLHNKRWAAADLVYRSQKLNQEDWQRYHEAWLLPYLDVDTLAKDPANLLALLHFRTHHTLQNWFRFDYEQIRIPFLEGTIGLAYNPHCVVVHGNRYGDLVQWERKAAHRGDMVGLPRAEVTLEAQEALAAFLEAVVNLPLEQDAPEGGEKWTALVETDFNRPQSDCLLASFASTAFGPPPVWDTRSMAASVKARVAIVKVAIECTQTEPEHVRALVRRTKNAVSFSKQSEFVQQQQIVRIVMRDYNILAYMNAVFDDLTRLARVGKENVVAGRARTAKHEVALQLLTISVDDIIQILMRDIWNETMQVSSFESRGCPCGNRHLLCEPRDLHNDDPLFWCIWQICTHQEHGGFDLKFLLGHLYQVIDGGSRKEKARISPNMQILLEDLAVFVNIWDGIRLHCPHPIRIMYGHGRNEIGMQWKDDKEWYINCTANAEALAGPEDFLEPLMILAGLPAPKSKAEDAPGDLLRYATAQTALDEFWAWVCQAHRYFFEDVCMSEERIRLYLRPILARENKRHVASMRTVTKKLRTIVVGETPGRSTQDNAEKDARTAGKRDIKNLSIELASCRRESQTVWGSTDSPSTPVATPKEKVKTRPAVADTPSPAVADAPPQPSAPPIAGNKVLVSSESLTLFDRMFDSLAASKHTACVAWEDFLAAMTDAGCGIEQKGGSAVAFWVAAKREGTVIVHRPHPDPKINPIMLRDCGKKLTKYFGWDEDSFVLRSKEDEKEKSEREAWILGCGRG
ncbi:hypothetical protein LTR78_008989 [Recurvomyces mirabilis]|uniref:Uncharacterized protein n=1 Tax=Recurvomyces mirabilis TaxID=574656 RepID=A0AAE0TP68_9PEZI|nr:hypothetical protein LTR78_008989 [Recurvomyces mirabilis]KAK5159789.1 hypothetical protein LTS14_001894 [Recurvomyces mirabilis]